MMTNKFSLKRNCLALLLAAAGCLPALAQDFNTVAPQQPPAQGPGAIITPPTPAVPAPAADKRLLDNLNGLRFVNSVQKLVRSGVGGSGISIESLQVMDSAAMRAQLSPFLGKPLMTSDLPKISKLVIDWYRAHNHPVVDVVFPEQDINSGVVQAVVTDYRLGKVKVVGNNWFSSDVISGEMQITPGDTIDFNILKEDLNRLNHNPFHTVNAVFVKSDEVGATDITLQTQDRLPLRVYASYDNTGLPITGRDRYSAGFNYGNLFGLDQQISYQFITSPDLWRSGSRGRTLGLSTDPRFAAHSVNYDAPLPNGDAINIFGFYVEQVPNLGPDFGQVGHGFQASIRYDKSMAPAGKLSQQLQFGFDYKRYDNNLAFGGQQIFSSVTKVAQFIAIYDATLVDDYGQTAFENQAVFSPGNLLSGNNSATFQASGVSQANATYGYDNLQVTRITTLPENLSLVMRALAQLSTDELLPSEQLGAGGLDSVRGYDARVANGSQGIVLSTELRSPTFAIFHQISDPGITDQAQLLAFWDYGMVSYKHQQVSLPQNSELQSVGVGARYNAGRFFSLRLDYGWQLEKAPGAAKLGNLANVVATFAY